MCSPHHSYAYVLVERSSRNPRFNQSPTPFPERFALLNTRSSRVYDSGGASLTSINFYTDGVGTPDLERLCMGENSVAALARSGKGQFPGWARSHL